MNLRANYRRYLCTFFTVCAQSVFLFLHMRNDPEPYHSGFVYAQALAVSQGLLPNLNFLSPYGVTGPVLGGIWLALTDNSLLSLHIFYGILTILTGYMLQRALSGHLGFGPALTLNIVWVLTFITTIPWPSIITTLFTLVSFYLLGQFVSDKGASLRKVYLSVFFSVFLLHLAILTRIHIAVALILISAVLILKNELLNKGVIRAWFLANLVIGVSLIALLSLMGVFMQYVNQAILWPLTYFSSPPLGIAYWINYLWFPLFLFAVVFHYRVLVRVLAITNLKKRLLYLTSILGISSFLVFLIASIDTTNAAPTLRDPLGFFSVFRSNSQVALGFAVCCLFVIAVFRDFIMIGRFQKERKKSDHFSISQGMYFSLGIVGLVQLVPLHDNVHIWFITPLLAVAAFGLLFSYKPRVIRKSPFILVSSILILSQLLSFERMMSVERVQMQSSELRGMYGSAEFARTTDAIMLELAKLGPGRTLRNECPAGLFSLSERRFVSVDGNFIGNFFVIFTDYVPKVDERNVDPEHVFLCNITFLEAEYWLNQGYKEIFKLANTENESPTPKLYSVILRKP